MSEEVAQNTAQAEVKVKPLSSNAFIAFFQKIARWWLGVWYGFADKHPKAAPIIYKVFFFVVFSYGVTIWQLLVMLFLPYAFSSMNTGAVGWPHVLVGETGQYYEIFGDTQGWGYFIAFEIAVFTAQCINFPLQRNITYKSKGNPWFQAMWYFIGWVLVSVATNAIWGICNVFLVYWSVPDGVTALLKTVLTGGVSMVVFFFVFLVIFPDQQKAAKTAEKKLETLKASGADEEKIKEAELNAIVKAEAAKLDTARKDQISAESLANAKAVSWDASVKLFEKMKAENQPAEEINNQEKIVADKYRQAVEAAQKRDEAIAANQAAIAEVEAARAARA